MRATDNPRFTTRLPLCVSVSPCPLHHPPKRAKRLHSIEIAEPTHRATTTHLAPQLLVFRTGQSHLPKRQLQNTTTRYNFSTRIPCPRRDVPPYPSLPGSLATWLPGVSPSVARQTPPKRPNPARRRKTNPRPSRACATGCNQMQRPSQTHFSTTPSYQAPPRAYFASPPPRSPADTLTRCAASRYFRAAADTCSTVSARTCSSNSASRRIVRPACSSRPRIPAKPPS
jgi:hypothetical protein